jgi:hypothetical protein
MEQWGVSGKRVPVTGKRSQRWGLAKFSICDLAQCSNLAMTHRSVNGCDYDTQPPCTAKQKLTADFADFYSPKNTLRYQCSLIGDIHSKAKRAKSFAVSTSTFLNVFVDLCCGSLNHLLML